MRLRSNFHPTHSLERLEPKQILSAAAVCPFDDIAQVAAAEPAPQYIVNHPPRIQLGNAPLVGTPAFDGLDQIEIIWQTIPAAPPGMVGSLDDFVVEYRRSNEAAWRNESAISTLDTEVGGRLMHSAVIRGLDWDASYEYRVQHRRAGATLATYQHQFRTRISAGDPRGFSFAAYGDSSNHNDNFRSVQARINRSALDFSLLLGDNAYAQGNHDDYDYRLQPAKAPEAVAWTSGHVDYAAIGTHDMFDVPIGDPTPRGETTRELYSPPIPRKGMTSTVDIPENEFVENNFSFDYGDVHFVAFDSNTIDFENVPEIRRQRIDRLIDFVAADLRASTAKWKIVFAHNPFIGTEKKLAGTPFNDEFYFQKIVSSLNAVGADLVLVGHSHTYSWTYPLAGFNDSNGSGHIEIEEVSYLRDLDRAYDKGSGIVQVVSGAGGGSLRQVDYSEPVFASAYSNLAPAGPLEYGFAKIDVNPRELKVSYISAATGQIVGDTNLNGQPDPSETYFAQFRIVDPMAADPDVNSDGRLDERDIDAVFAAARDGLFTARMDFDRNAKMEQADAMFLIENYLKTAPGDANLDGTFDSRDLVLIFQAGQYDDSSLENSTWATGDWDGDGEFSSADLVFAFQTNVYSTPT